MGDETAPQTPIDEQLAHESAQYVLWVARHAIITLQGRQTTARPVNGYPMPAFASTPPGVPVLQWADVVHKTASDGQPEGITGSLGEYIARVFYDQPPATVANGAFYAGVLAVKLGLVDADVFRLWPDEPDTHSLVDASGA